MITFNDDYFSIKEEDGLSDQLYYWSDVARVAYYVHRKSGYYGSSSGREVYIIIEHDCGDYLRIPCTSIDASIFEESVDKYLSQVVEDRKKLLKDAPEEKLIDFYVRM